MVMVAYGCLQAVICRCKIFERHFAEEVGGGDFAGDGAESVEAAAEVGGYQVGREVGGSSPRRVSSSASAAVRSAS